jgi:hypothetical protein
MKKRFIVFVDFSVFSANLLKYAYSWAVQTEASVLLVHHLDLTFPAFTDAETRKAMAEDLLADTQAKMQIMVQTELPEGAMVQVQVITQPLKIALKQLLNSSFETLFFVGQKGTGPLKQLFIGSMALELIENSPKTVAAIPKDINHFTQKKLYVGVTEKYPLNTEALGRLLKLFPKQALHLTFFFLAKTGEASPNMQEMLEQLACDFAHMAQTDYQVYEGESAFSAIKQIVQHTHEEMLVLQKGSRLLTDKLFRKFLINELVYEGAVPMLVLP